MKKLRLEMDDLQVASFDPEPGVRGEGTAHGHGKEACSMQPTCGIDSRADNEAYEQGPRTRWCCV